MSEAVSPLTISATPNGFVVVGEIDASTVEQLTQTLIPLDDGPPEVAIDMAQVEFIDSSGLRVLIQAHQHAEASGRRIVIANPSPIVSRLFAVSGLTELFHIR